MAVPNTAFGASAADFIGGIPILFSGCKNRFKYFL